MADHGSLLNVLSNCIFSGVKMIDRDGSVVMSFVCYYGVHRQMGAYMERNRLVWEAME